MNTTKTKTIFLLLFLSLFFAFPASSDEQKEKAAIKAAENFLQLVDSGQYEASWKEAASFFKDQVPKEIWVQQISSLRPLFGEVIKRDIFRAKYNRSLPGVPDGEYVVISIKSSFENKEKAIETITPMLDKDGQWRVSGYFIK